LKKDGVTTKEVPLIGANSHAPIDHLFWYLPFASVKQGNSLVEELEDLTEDDWSIKREEIRDEHKLERAANDLRVSWKAWIRNHWPNKSGTTSRIKRPAEGLKTIVRDE
jgi:hypothetical protein